MVAEKLIYGKLSYEIVGALFDVFNQIGAGHKEKVYQKAISVLLMKKGIKFNEQVKVDLEIYGEKIGNYFIDFVVDDKIVLEIKRDVRFSKQEFDQTTKYLESTGLKLAILATFRKEDVKFYRVVNVKQKKSFSS